MKTEKLKKKKMVKVILDVITRENKSGKNGRWLPSRCKLLKWVRNNFGGGGGYRRT